MSIDIRRLPQEIQDIIELKEATEQTFTRFADIEYTELFWNKVMERANPEVEHSLLLTIVGSQGIGKCYSEVTKISTKQGIVEGKDLVVGDVLFDENGAETVVRNKWFSNRDCVEVCFDFANDVVLSNEHRVMTARGLISANELVVGDFVQVSSRVVSRRGSVNEYDRAFVFGAYLADGCTVIHEKSPVKGKRNKLRKMGWSYFVSISNNDKRYLEFVAERMRREFGFFSVNVRAASGKGRFVLVATGRDEVFAFAELCGLKSAEKKVPIEIFESREGVRGFLDGYCNGDMVCNVVKSKRGTFRTEVGWLLKSEIAAMGVLDALHIEGFWPSVKVRELKSGKWCGNKYYRMTLPAKIVEEFLQSRYFVNANKYSRVQNVLLLRKKRSVGVAYNTLNGNRTVTNDICVVRIGEKLYSRVLGLKHVGCVRCVDIEVSGKSHLFQFAGGIVTHNSMSAISICCALDPNFSIDKIFFNYNDLVYNRSKILPNTAVLVDEQSELFGLDSHRVNIILQNLKEQLRKKSVHFIFCAPTLYPEHQTSMYILEAMYIDFETREVYAALKTREGLTLGHVRIPHPLKILDDGVSLATEDLIFEYNKKKDEHLDHILGQKNIDIFEERANQIMNHVLFKKAERIYKSKMGYIPSGALVQLINKIFPEYMSGVVPLEIAGRIKLDKELSGDWEVAGKVTRRDRAGGKRRL